MSIAFSNRLSLLRREQNRTQREAAEALGVSQALLSHYENGIRECSLDFVVKACAYYGVSADYMLGVTQEKKPSLFADPEGPEETEDELTAATLLRALWSLYRAEEEAGEESAGRFLDFFSLSVKRYFERLSPAAAYSAELLTLAESLLLTRGALPSDFAGTRAAAAIAAVEANADAAIRRELQKLV